MKIIILDDSSRTDRCEGNCGTDWSSAEELALAMRRIEERFGKGVQLEYIDLAKPSPHPAATRLKQMADHEKLSFPALLVDDRPRISGLFDIRLLLDVIEAESEVKRE